MASRKTTRLQALLCRMQAVLIIRRAAYQMFPPMTAALLDMRLRVYGASLVAEMRQLEGGK